MAAALRSRQAAHGVAAAESAPAAGPSSSTTNHQGNLALAVAARFHAQRRHAAGGAPAGFAYGKSRVIVDNPLDPNDPGKTDFFELFRTSVQQRTVGNTALRRFIRACDEATYQRALYAIEGAKAGGLRVDHDTYDALLALLLRSGQLKQALDTYNRMLEEKVTPHTRTFNSLIDLCAERQLADSAERIFNEMVRRGRQPDVETYEAMMRAYASEVPPKWEKAVAIFDKLQRNSNATVSANTYNSLMHVYMNMEPFDWRVVYNCYFEMRYHKPKILFGWNSYELVAKALKKGNAGKWRRLVTFVDAWIQLTVMWSWDFWFGIMVAFCTLGIVRAITGTLLHSSGAKVMKNSRGDETHAGVISGPAVSS